MLRIPASPRKATPYRYTAVDHAETLAFDRSGTPACTCRYTGVHRPKFVVAARFGSSPAGRGGAFQLWTEDVACGAFSTVQG